MAFAPQQSQPTTPNTRCGYRKDNTDKWKGLPFREWSWARLKSDINASFRKGDMVCLLDVGSARISPTPHPQAGLQPTSWQKSDADTKYRIAKWVEKNHVELVACGDGRSSISHNHLGGSRSGTPETRRAWDAEDIVYLLSSSPRITVPQYFVKLRALQAGAAAAGDYVIPTYACGKVQSLTSHSSGSAAYQRLQKVAPPVSTLSRQYYVVHFPVQWETAEWGACDVAVNTAYLEPLSRADNVCCEKRLTQGPPPPKVVILPEDRVASRDIQAYP